LPAVTFHKPGGRYTQHPSGAGWSDRLGLGPLPGLRGKTGDLSAALQ
jgi:hypothetical protein